MRDLVWLVLAVLMLVAGYLLQKADVFQKWTGKAPETAVYVQDCDLRLGACDIDADGQKLLLTIDPHDIQVLRPLIISLKYPENADKLPEKVSIEFEGVNMDMGYNRFLLASSGSGLFMAKGMLPACTAETMYWRIHLLIENAGIISDFQFSLATKIR